MGEDSKLVLALQSHRRKLQDAALEQLYFRNQPSIVAYVRRNSGTKEDAEEVLQDALVVLFQAVHKPGWQLTAKLDTYLFGIVRNIWFKRLRKQRRTIDTISMEDQVVEAAADGTDPPENEAGKAMIRLLKQLSPRCRDVLTMIYVEEKGIIETMEALHYQSEQAVRNKKSNCLKKLRERYRSGGKGGDDA